MSALTDNDEQGSLYEKIIKRMLGELTSAPEWDRDSVEALEESFLKESMPTQESLMKILSRHGSREKT